MKEKYYTVARTISRWKLDNWLENYLGYKADTSEFWKWLYVKYYQLFDSQYFRGGVLLSAKEIERQRPNHSKIINKIGVKKLRRDMLYSLHRFGASFDDYFIYQFYNKNHYARSSFNTLKMQYGYCEIVNDEAMRDLFEDKGALYNALKKFYKRDLLVVYGDAELQDLKKFFLVHKSFVFKPFNGHSGHGIRIFRDIEETAEAFYQRNITKGAFVAEELIEQHPAMAVLHPASINTIRLATFRIDNEVNIMSAALRMGSGGANVDNAGSGGIYASIDVVSGIVNSLARDNLSNYHIKHPDTKQIIAGFEIPDWQAAIEFVKEVALVI